MGFPCLSPGPATPNEKHTQAEAPSREQIPMKINTRCSGETHRDDLSTHPDGLMPRKGEIISVWKRGACLLSPAPQEEQLEGDTQHTLCVCACMRACDSRGTLGSITQPATKPSCSRPLAHTSPPPSISPFQGLPLPLGPEPTPIHRGLCLPEGPAKAPNLLADSVDLLALPLCMGPNPVPACEGSVWKG